MCLNLIRMYFIEHINNNMVNLFNWATSQGRRFAAFLLLNYKKRTMQPLLPPVSLERRWSSRTFRYGYLVTTSPQLSDLPSAAPSFRLGHRLRAFPTPMVWRAVCTRPGNAFTATFWFAITSDSSFTQSSCRLRSELGRYFWDSLRIAPSPPFVYAIVARV